MKRRGPCPKCEGSVMYVPRVAESHDGRPEPMRLVALAHDPSASVGDLEARVCRECGYVGLKRNRSRRSGRSPRSWTIPRNHRAARPRGADALYVKNPEAIPLDGETAWLLARDTPYR